jgi:DNA-binding response OmpR family regulator
LKFSNSYKSEDGYQLLKYIDLNDTAVIVVTAKTTHLDVYKGFEQGAVDYTIFRL